MKYDVNHKYLLFDTLQTRSIISDYAYYANRWDPNAR